MAIEEPEPGTGGGGGLGAVGTVIVALLSALFGLFGGRGRSDTAQALDGLRRGIVDLGKQVLGVIREVALGFARVWGLLSKVWTRVLKPLLQAIQKAFLRLRGWLERIFGPVLRFLERIRGYLRRFYERFVRPVLDAIELARFLLRGLGALGVEWAKKLDEKLGQIEDQITRRYLQLLGALNRVIDTIDRIVTLDFIFQRFVYLRSLQRYAREVHNHWWNRQSAAARGGSRGRRGDGPARLEFPAYYAAFRGVLRGDGSALDREIDEGVRDLFLTLRR